MHGNGEHPRKPNVLRSCLAMAVAGAIIWAAGIALALALIASCTASDPPAVSPSGTFNPGAVLDPSQVHDWRDSSGYHPGDDTNRGA